MMTTHALQLLQYSEKMQELMKNLSTVRCIFFFFFVIKHETNNTYAPRIRAAKYGLIYIYIFQNCITFSKSVSLSSMTYVNKYVVDLKNISTHDMTRN